MSLPFVRILCLSKLLLISLALILQLIAICSPWWAQFTSETDLGKPPENGHYGLWSLCSSKGPHWNEDCDPLDTFFQLPPYSRVSGVVGTLHILLQFALIPLSFIRTLQVFKHLIDYGIKTKALFVTELLLSFLTTIFAVLVAVFISIGENEKEYSVVKGWSFWVEISIIVINVVVTSLCVYETLRSWRMRLQQQIDPMGKQAETYGNPSFDTDSPTVRRSTNGSISVTESSGHPYEPNPQPMSKPDKSLKSKNAKEAGETSQTLTYENECFQESSPTLERANTSRH